MELYRRRQRRRGIIAWSVASLLVVLIGLAVAFGGEEGGSSPSPPPDISLFSAEMTSSQYDQIHKGQDEQLVIDRLGNVGVQEAEAKETGVSEIFPAPPPSSICSYWTLSDAPDHHVRLCFSDPQGVLVEKSVRAPGEGGAETTLA